MKKTQLKAKWLMELACIVLVILIAVSAENPRVKKSTAYHLTDCEACMSFIETFIFTFHMRSYPTSMHRNFVKNDCKKYPGGKICEVLIDQKNIDVMWALNAKNVSSRSMCDFFLDDVVCYTSAGVHLEFSSKKLANRSTTPSVKVKRKLKILHISNFADFDLAYENNSVVSNDTTSCSAKHPSTCLFESALKHASKTHKNLDIVFWTEGLTPNDSSSGSRTELQKNYHHIVELFQKYLGYVHNVYPSIGIHDDLNSILTPDTSFNVTKFYEFLPFEWSHLFPSDGEKNWRKNVKSIIRGGYYSVPIKPGLRLISLNGNDCNKYNLEVIRNKTELTEQLAWLTRELGAAEKSREKVLILNSMPPSHPDCVQGWRRSYNEIVNRYEATIVAQFYGRSVRGEIEIFYDAKDKKRPVSVGYPLQSKNPSYSIYQIDGYYANTTWEVLDMETYSINATESNQIWRKVGDARKDARMSTLLPRDWNNFIQRTSECVTRFANNQQR